MIITTHGIRESFGKKRKIYEKIDKRERERDEGEVKEREKEKKTNTLYKDLL